ncbi:unnamed protein product [Clonostachys rosea f. rosea IK726]|uniref:Uncharacterized protein n=1 Tax=Clonostachys rosea f. rosea IK726 TaxID=1349383 RepID=A0ACA9TG58_BIOOC|nr:unnamed protein product [Clonostachys rosea f. rosea IK726]
MTPIAGTNVIEQSWVGDPHLLAHECEDEASSHLLCRSDGLDPRSNSTSNSGQGSGQGGSSTDRDTHYIDRADKNIRDFESKFTPKGGSGSGTSGNK